MRLVLRAKFLRIVIDQPKTISEAVAGITTKEVGEVTNKSGVTVQAGESPSSAAAILRRSAP